MNCHDDAKLNALIGKKVKAQILGKTYTGILEKSKNYPRKYKINNNCFCKTHVDWIQEA